MEGTTTELQREETRERVSYRALEEPTMCGAFQVTSSEHPDRVALGTKGAPFTMTWAEYPDRARALPGGVAGRGRGHGDTTALPLPNRRRFHWANRAAMNP